MHPAPQLAAVRMVDVSVDIGGRRVLDRVTLDIETGRVTGILGPNGAGKSTLLGVLVGLRPCTAGDCLVLGEPLRRHGRALRRRIGVVLQDTALYDELTARENLAFSASLYGVGGGGPVDHALQLMGLTDRAGQRVGTLSGGLRRRVAIARALIHSPELLIVDEPTLGVDADARNAIWTHLRWLRAQGTTVVVASNYLDEVQALCDRVAVLRDGRLVADEPPEALIARAGHCVDVECDPDAVGGVRSAAAAVAPGARVEATPAGAVVFLRDEQVAAVVRALLDAPGVRGFRVRPPDLAEVLRVVAVAADRS